MSYPSGSRRSSIWRSAKALLNWKEYEKQQSGSLFTSQHHCHFPPSINELCNFTTSFPLSAQTSPRCSRLHSFIFLYLTTDTNFDSMYHGIMYIYWRCKYKMWYEYLYLSNWFFWSMELTYRLSNFAFSSLQESLQLSHLANWIHQKYLQ